MLRAPRVAEAARGDARGLLGERAFEPLLALALLDFEAERVDAGFFFCEERDPLRVARPRTDTAGAATTDSRGDAAGLAATRTRAELCIVEIARAAAAILTAAAVMRSAATRRAEWDRLSIGAAGEMGPEAEGREAQARMLVCQIAPSSERTIRSLMCFSRVMSLRSLRSSLSSVVSSRSCAFGRAGRGIRGQALCSRGRGQRRGRERKRRRQRRGARTNQQRVGW